MTNYIGAAEFFNTYVDHTEACQKGITSVICTCGLTKNLPHVLSLALEGEKKTNVERILVYKAEDGYRWQARAGNGEIVASGESHTSNADARRAASGVFPGVPIFKAALNGPRVEPASE